MTVKTALLQESSCNLITIVKGQKPSKPKVNRLAK